MPDFYAVIGSVTSASRLKRELEMRGIRSHIVPTPDTKTGCSYSLLLPARSRNLVAKLSKKYNIKRLIDTDSGGGL